MKDDSEETNDSHPVRDRIRSWLMAERWTLANTSNKAASWAMVGTDNQGKKVVFARLAKQPDLLLLQGNLIVDEARRRSLAALPARRRHELLWELRFRLLGMQLMFSGVGMPLEKVVIEKKLYVDELRRTEFMAATARVQHGLLAVIWSLNRVVGGSPPPEDLGGMVH